MKFIKNAFFLCAFIYSCSLLSSAPALMLQDIKTPEFILGEYQNKLTIEMTSIANICQKNPLIKGYLEKPNQIFQNSIETEQLKKFFLERQGCGASEKELNVLNNQINQLNENRKALQQQFDIITEILNKEQSWGILNHTVTSMNLYFAKADYLQTVVNTQITKIQQQGAQIRALQAELNLLKNANKQQKTRSTQATKSEDMDRPIRKDCSQHQVVYNLRKKRKEIVLDSGNLNTDQK